MLNIVSMYFYLRVGSIRVCRDWTEMVLYDFHTVYYDMVVKRYIR